MNSVFNRDIFQLEMSGSDNEASSQDPKRFTLTIRKPEADAPPPQADDPPQSDTSATHNVADAQISTLNARDGGFYRLPWDAPHDTALALTWVKERVTLVDP